MFDHDRDEVLDRAEAAGIERILVPGYDLASSHAALRLAAARPDLIHVAVGIHPHHAAQASEADWVELERLVQEPAVVAVGEIGLDYHRNLSPPAVQRAAFSRQLDLAGRTGKPVLVHDREAHDDITTGLTVWDGPGEGRVRGVLHAFSGDREMAERLVEAGFLISFALPLVFRSAHGPRAAAAALPAGSFLVETDAPWLAPGGADERNEPTTALRVAAALARLRSVEPEEVATDVRAAYERLVAPPAEVEEASPVAPLEQPAAPEQPTGVEEPTAVEEPTQVVATADDPAEIGGGAPDQPTPTAEAPAGPMQGIGLGVVIGVLAALVVLSLMVWLLIFEGGGAAVTLP